MKTYSLSFWATSFTAFKQELDKHKSLPVIFIQKLVKHFIRICIRQIVIYIPNRKNFKTNFQPKHPEF